MVATDILHSRFNEARIRRQTRLFARFHCQHIAALVVVDPGMAFHPNHFDFVTFVNCKKTFPEVRILGLLGAALIHAPAVSSPPKCRTRRDCVEYLSPFATGRDRVVPLSAATPPHPSVNARSTIAVPN